MSKSAASRKKSGSQGQNGQGRVGSNGSSPNDSAAVKYTCASQIAIICCVLAALTIGSYIGVAWSDFLSYDDTDYVLQNRHIQHGVTAQSIKWAFTTFYASNYHPLTWLSHMVDWTVFGNHPGAHHLVNLALHTANALLLFLLLAYMTGFLWRSAMVAFLFALHPIHVESVAWIAERKDVLSTFFWFATTLAYAWYVRKRSWKRMAAVILGFALGLLAKPMVVTLPFTLLLLDFWPLKRAELEQAARLGTIRQWALAWWKLCFEKLPLFLMTVASGILTYMAQKAGGAVSTELALPAWVRFCNAAMSYWRYIGKMFWPNPLITYYHHEARNINVPVAMALAGLLVVVTFVFWQMRKKRPYYISGWLWYVGTLVPVIGFPVQVGVQAMAERYSYIPLVGLFAIIVWAISDYAGNLPELKSVVKALSVIVIAIMVVLTFYQVVTVWKNTITLFSHVLEADPRGEFPNLSLGAAYMRQNKMEEAQHYLECALQYNSSGPQTLSYYAFCLMEKKNHVVGDTEKVRQALDRAYMVAPNNRDVLANKAEYCLQTGKPEEAEIYCHKILETSPEFVTAWFYLADALQAEKKLSETVETYHSLLKVEPENTDAHNNLGIVYGMQKMYAEAEREFRQSLALKPGQALAHTNLGRVYFESGQIPQAVAEFSEALRLDPSNAVAHNNYGAALLQQGVYDEAARQFAQAIQLAPEYNEARGNLTIAQAKLAAATGKKM